MSSSPTSIPPKSKVSIVVPVFNEEANLPELISRLSQVMDPLKRPYEILCVNDGSRDRSLAVLTSLVAQCPVLRVIDLQRNYGQHPAILAGFTYITGDVVVTLDADLQNPPEEIPKLLSLIDEGYDVVGGIRKHRNDALFRRLASRVVNRITTWSTSMPLKDFGCMLRAYSRDVIDHINRCDEHSTFIPALAQIFARRPIEIEVEQAARASGRSSYSLYRLIRLNFDLMTGFSVVPLQMFTLLGFVVASTGVGFGIYLLIRRFVLLRQSEAEGVFTLFALAFVVLGMVLGGLGIVGEYIGRIYQELRRRPRYLVHRVFEGSTPGLVIFAYSELGHACLKRLIDKGETIRAVFTHDDAPGESIWFPSVAALARQHGIPVFMHDGKLGAQDLQRLQEWAPELILSFYYRNLLPAEVLRIPRRGAFNMHGSLLPKYRGRAPINWAILSGETETGATLHEMVEQADAGGIIDQEAVPIGPDDTASMVQQRVTQAALRILDRQLEPLKAGTATRRPQAASQASVFGRRRPDDGKIEWSRPARDIHNLIRAVTHPYPGAFTDHLGKRLFIWSSRAADTPKGFSGAPGSFHADHHRLYVLCGDGRAIEILRAQWAGDEEKDGAELSVLVGDRS
jgi:undecaprenyl-phosphate 4-deoxy-4-formamido-L-arabinose transferase